MNDPELIIFDGDDTLWISEILYDRARQSAALVVHEAGVNADVWDKLQREIDVANVEILGLSPERFPLSCRQAYEQLAGDGADPQVARDVQDAARAVFSAKADLAPGVNEMLASIPPTTTTVLLTKGESAVQTRRINDSGLAPHFDYLVVVPTKTASTFRAVAELSGIQPHKAWSVGNSLRSDIEPALSIGMRAFWIDAHVWEFERRHTNEAPPGVVVLDGVAQVSAYLLDAKSTATRGLASPGVRAGDDPFATATLDVANDA